MIGVIGLGVGLFLFIAMLSLQAGRLVMGPFGKTSAGLFYGLAGVPGYFLIALGLVAAVRCLLERDPVMPILVTVGVVIGVFSLATLVHLAAPTYRVAGYGPGGAIGEHFAEVFRAVISTAGTALLGLVGLVVAAVVATPLRMRDVLRAIGRGLVWALGGVRAGLYAFAGFWADVFRAILPGKDHSNDEDDEEENVLEVDEDDGVVDPLIIERGASAAAEEKKPRKKKTAQGTEIDFAPPAQLVEEPAAELPKPPKRSRMAHGTQAPEIEEAKADAAKPEPALADDAGPVIVESRFKNVDKAAMAAKEKAAEAERQTFIKLGEGDYKLPSIQLLKYDSTQQNTIDKNAMLELSAKLTQTLENYGVKGDVVAIRPGPVVTMYEFAPAPGTR
ncbi:MAG TPA: DNA translocase FtsK 4TM domain-containing protein, partial [Kofleriaceae bacterium]|nr:DNA translocase FtsK 4TM domain-containing protein [Kofleriaceae bacterium]